MPRSLVLAAAPPSTQRPAAMPHALIRSVAQKAGVPKHNTSLLWLVRDALSAPMPPGWEASADGEGWTNVERGETVKSHPCLSYLRRAIAKAEKEKENQVAPVVIAKGRGKASRPSSGKGGKQTPSPPLPLSDGIKLGELESGGGDGYGLRRGGPWLECSELDQSKPGAPLAVYWYHFGQRKRLNEHPAMWLARRRVKATLELQRCGRGMLARRAKVDAREGHAATILQAVYRSLAARYLLKQKRRWRVESTAVNAAVSFQKVWRGRKGRRRGAQQRIVVWEMEEHRSAAAIQARWRERGTGRFDAAAALQARWRGIGGRRAVERKRMAIENEKWRRKCAAEEEAKRRVEAEARAKSAKAEKQRKIVDAAAAAEAAEQAAEAEKVRIAELYAENRRREQEKRAVERLQAAGRGWLAREEMRQQRSAVSRLQAVVRGDILRRERRCMAGAATRVQAARRGMLGRRLGAYRAIEVQKDLERKSSVLLQRSIRSWLGQRDTAASGLQARWRGRVGRRKAVKRKAKVSRREKRAAEAKARAEDFRRAALDALDLGDPVGNLALRSAKYAGGGGIGGGASAGAGAGAAVPGLNASSGAISGVRSGAVSALGQLEGLPTRRAATTGGLGFRNGAAGSPTQHADYLDSRTKELARTGLMPKFGQLDGGRRFEELRNIGSYGLAAASHVNTSHQR